MEGFNLTAVLCGSNIVRTMPLFRVIYPIELTQFPMSTYGPHTAGEV